MNALRAWSWFRLRVLGFGVKGSRCRVCGSGLRDWVRGLRAVGYGVKKMGLCFRSGAWGLRLALLPASCFGIQPVKACLFWTLGSNFHQLPVAAELPPQKFPFQLL